MSDLQLDTKLRAMYTSLWAMNPPKVLAGIGQILAKGVSADFKQLFGNDFHVAMGYYSKDLKADIGFLNSYPSRITLFFNLYLTEFIADYLFYLENKNDTVICYIYGKQLRNFEYHTGNQEMAAFYNKMYFNAKNTLGDVRTEHYLKALILSEFVIIHEWAHQQEDLISPLQAQLNKMQEEMLLGLTPKDMEEIACDCSALIIMESLKYKSKARITKEEILGVSANLMILINLYSCFSEFTIDSINSGNQNTTKKLDEVVDTLGKRATGLMLLIAFLQKNGDFFQNTDLIRTRDIFETTGNLLENVKHIINTDLNNDIKSFQMLPVEEKKAYYLSEPEDVWFYYL